MLVMQSVQFLPTDTQHSKRLLVYVVPWYLLVSSCESCSQAVAMWFLRKWCQTCNQLTASTYVYMYAY